MNLDELLAEYQRLPEYSGATLTNVNQLSLFKDYPINIAATRGSIVEMAILLENGADINASGEHGYLPIHNATEQDKSDAISWLIKNGASVITKNNDGLTAKELAEVLGNKKALDVLADC